MARILLHRAELAEQHLVVVDPVPLRPGVDDGEIAVDERPRRGGVEIDLHHLLGLIEHGAALVGRQREIGVEPRARLAHRRVVGAAACGPGRAGQRVIEPLAHPRRALMREQIRLVEVESVDERREACDPGGVEIGETLDEAAATARGDEREPRRSPPRFIEQSRAHRARLR